MTIHWRQYQEMQKISEIGDRFISYVDRGSGPPVVLLHGIPTWGYVWADLIPALEKTRRVLVPDLPGFGYSDRRDRFGRSIARQGGMISAWLRKLGVEKADFIGHDIGGGVALRLAALEPKLVGRLCLLDTVCYDSWPAELMLQFSHPGVYRRFSARAALQVLRLALRQGFSAPREEMLEGLLSPYSTEVGKLSLIRNAAALDTNLTMEIVPLLPHLRKPTLILWGADDPFQSLYYGRRLASDLPRSLLVVLPQARHFVHLDKPKEAAAQITAFLGPRETMTTIWTVGHSTRGIDELVALLQAYGIELVVDIRPSPSSRRNPQFNRPALEAALPAAGVGYEWLGLELGDQRPQANPESPHKALRNRPLRNFADHMDTPVFQETMRHVLEIASGRRVALMCSEQHWWRCHRSLIADWLLASNAEVVHIQDKEKSEPHHLPSAARVAQGRVFYDRG